MQRNKVFAGLSLAIAGAAIGAGALVSSSAMADDAPAPSAGTVDVVTVGPDGAEAIHCSFDDIEMPTLQMSDPGPAGGGVIAVGVSADGTLPGRPEAGDGPFTISGGSDSNGPTVVVGGSGTIQSGSIVEGSVQVGDLQSGSIPAGDGQSGTLVVSGNVVPVGADGVPVGADGVPVGAVNLISADQAREGTAEECAAIRATFTDATPVPVTPNTQG